MPFFRTFRLGVILPRPWARCQGWTQHDLADMLAAFHQAVRPGGLREWKPGEHVGLQPAVSQFGPDMARQCVADRAFLGECPQPHGGSGDVQAFEQDRTQIHISTTAFEKRDTHQPSVASQQGDITTEIRQADDIEYDVDSRAPGHLHHRLGKVGRAVIDGVGGAKCSAEGRLVIAADRDDTLDAQMLRQQDGGKPDTTRATMYEQALAGLEGPEVHEICPDRKPILGQRRRGGEVHTLGDRQHVRGRRQAKLGVAASRDEGCDRIADGPVMDAGAECGDPP